MAQWALSQIEGRLIEEFRTLQRRSQEFKLEIIASMSHGVSVVSLRPTPYLRIESKEPLSLAIDD